MVMETSERAKIRDDLAEEPKQRFYLPSLDLGVDSKEYLKRYIEREFPQNVVYSVPKCFQRNGERRATMAEEKIFTRLENLHINDMWMIFFHSSSYAGRSARRDGKLMIREHDFVLFVRQQDKLFLALVEVKSTNDQRSDLEHSSDAKVIKNNKRSAQHQLRDHLEVIEKMLQKQEKAVQSYIMWPFLGQNSKDSTRRWKEDKNLHVFEEMITNQVDFDNWFKENILGGASLTPEIFYTLLSRCGVFVQEIDKGLMALLTQEQLHLLNTDICQQAKALVVHGAAGTGKTLLVLRKLEMLYRAGQLDENNRALYICYWPGIRYDMELKMESLGIRPFVDTARFYISMPNFLQTNRKTYKHVFMDESEAICLALDSNIIHNTIARIYERYHDGNCPVGRACAHGTLSSNDAITQKMSHHDTSQWGELWFTVDINQASLFLPRHSPEFLKTPSILLNKVMRATGSIFTVFKQFYSMPMPLLPKKILDNFKIPDISLGHHVLGPPVYWTEAKDVSRTTARVIVDLCGAKGFQAHHLCVLPFLVNERLVPEEINRWIDADFVENSFRPNGVRDVEYFLKDREINHFLVAWALRVKGLEFKVVIMVIDGDDFDIEDHEDRKKAYIMASRCTSMLILVSTESVRDSIIAQGRFEHYPFSLSL